jgi:hypothetical protein
MGLSSKDKTNRFMYVYRGGGVWGDTTNATCTGNTHKGVSVALGANRFSIDLYLCSSCAIDCN